MVQKRPSSTQVTQAKVTFLLNFLFMVCSPPILIPSVLPPFTSHSACITELAKYGTLRIHMVVNLGHVKINGACVETWECHFTRSSWVGWMEFKGMLYKLFTGGQMWITPHDDLSCERRCMSSFRVCLENRQKQKGAAKNRKNTHWQVKWKVTISYNSRGDKHPKVLATAKANLLSNSALVGGSIRIKIV